MQQHSWSTIDLPSGIEKFRSVFELFAQNEFFKLQFSRKFELRFSECSWYRLWSWD